MVAKQSFAVFMLLIFFRIATSGVAEAARQRRVTKIKSAYSDGIIINTCFFKYWTQFFGKKHRPKGLELAGLALPVKCKYTGLCYGGTDSQAQFAVCYNQNKLIPEFTGHILHPNIAGGKGDDEYITDRRIDPVATDEDYLNSGYDRGHLTPKGDFSTNEERDFTMYTTNLAPQRKKFNNGNWNNLEEALRTYATNNKQKLYIFTGTGGAAKDRNGMVMRLNDRVVVPQYYWKAVCDPKARQSIFFWAVNVDSNNGIEGEAKGCFQKRQSKELGVIKCSSLNEAKKLFKDLIYYIPEFKEESCKPSQKGVNFESITKKLQ
ncbi:nuclease EXOG, mitochondrial-like [Oculina patagonica]